MLRDATETEEAAGGSYEPELKVSICRDYSIVLHPVGHSVGLVTRIEGKGDQAGGRIAILGVPYDDPAYEFPVCETGVPRGDRRVDFKGDPEIFPFRHLREGLNAHEDHYGQLLTVYPAV